MQFSLPHVRYWKRKKQLIKLLNILKDTYFKLFSMQGNLLSNEFSYIFLLPHWSLITFCPIFPLKMVLKYHYRLFFYSYSFIFYLNASHIQYLYLYPIFLSCPIERTVKSFTFLFNLLLPKLSFHCCNFIFSPCIYP